MTRRVWNRCPISARSEMAGAPRVAARAPSRRPWPESGVPQGRPPVTVEVGPFPGFSAVNRFHAALAEAPGVGQVVVVGFREGQLCLRVDHPDVDALAALLERLHPGHARVLRPAADRLTVALGDDLPAPAVEPTTPGSTAGADDR